MEHNEKIAAALNTFLALIIADRLTVSEGTASRLMRVNSELGDLSLNEIIDEAKDKIVSEVDEAVIKFLEDNKVLENCALVGNATDRM